MQMTHSSKEYRNVFGRCAKTRLCFLLLRDQCFDLNGSQNTSPRLYKSTDFEENEAKFQVHREHVPSSRISRPANVKTSDNYYYRET